MIDDETHLVDVEGADDIVEALEILAGIAVLEGERRLHALILDAVDKFKANAS